MSKGQSEPARRIDFCITGLAVGGAERCLVELATRFAAEERIVAVHSLQPRPERDDLPRRLAAAGVEVVFHDARGSRDAWRIASTLTRRWNAAATRPDAVQTFLHHANLLGGWAARRAGVRRVFAGIRVAERRGRLRGWLEWATQRLADRHVCVSRSVADYCRDVVGIDERRLLVIPNGVDAAKLSALAPADLETLGVPPGRRLLTYVGRLDPQKGLRWLVEAAPAWLARLPDVDLALVGAGPQEAELRALAERRAIADRVRFLGWRPDAPAIMKASALVVLPSRWEGMPNVVLEAMAVGKPVLSTPVEGVLEALGEERADEQTCAYGNSVEWAEKLVRLASDAELAARLGRENKSRVERSFSLDAMFESYRRLYDGEPT